MGDGESESEKNEFCMNCMSCVQFTFWYFLNVFVLVARSSFKPFLPFHILNLPLYKYIMVGIVCGGVEVFVCICEGSGVLVVVVGGGD